MTILLVDDSPIQRLALALLLKEAGYTDLLMAGSAVEAFRYLQQDMAAQVDLILMDLNMPEINGIEACRQIKRMIGQQDVPIIMVTSSDETEDLKLAFAAGAIDYIIKPPKQVELIARVQSALKLKHETDGRKARERELQKLNERLENIFTDLAQKHRLLQVEQEKSERLLLNILPQPIAERLKQEPGIIAERFEEVTVLFADIVDFTPLSASVAPETLVTMLNDVFSLFDRLADKHGLEKIKTIGDAYMAVAGLPMPRPDHATAAVAMALDIQRELSGLALTPNGRPLRVRIGLHTGPVVAGVIGQKKFSYDLWGDTVNTASRMESHGIAGCIQVTETTYRHLRLNYVFEKRGAIQVKGKGEVVTYLLQDEKMRMAESLAMVR